MKPVLIQIILICCLSVVSAQDQKKIDAVLLGAYQINNCDWPEGESEYRIKNANVRDFVSHQYGWILKDLVIKFEPEYCIVHAGIEDFFIQIPVETTLGNYERIIDKLEEAGIKCILSNMFPFPLSSEYDERIMELNSGLRELAIQKNVAYIDAYEVFKNLSAFKKDSYQLNTLGIEVWKSLIVNELSKNSHDSNAEKRDFGFEHLSANRIDRIISNSPEEVKICMLGNSITHSGNWNEILDGKYVRNCGQGGYTTGQMLWHIDTTVIAADPTHCFIMGGINDFSLGLNHELVFSNYVEIIHRLEQAGIIPVIQSTLYQVEEAAGNREQVSLLNIKLKEYCLEKQLDYLDINSLVSKNNSLQKKYARDRTHLNSDGYKVWAKLLVKYLKKNNIEY